MSTARFAVSDAVGQSADEQGLRQRLGEWVAIRLKLGDAAAGRGDQWCGHGGKRLSRADRTWLASGRWVCTVWRQS